MKKSIVLIPLPSLIKKFVRSFVRARHWSKAEPAGSKPSSIWKAVTCTVEVLLTVHHARQCY